MSDRAGQPHRATVQKQKGSYMVAKDRFAALRAKSSQDLPEPFKFQNIDDELWGDVLQLHQIELKGKRVWQLVVDGHIKYANGDPIPGRYKLILTQDLVAKLVTQRDVRAGDAVSLRLARFGGNGFMEFADAVDPDRPRITAVPPSSEPWFDEDGNQMPDEPDYDDE